MSATLHFDKLLTFFLLSLSKFKHYWLWSLQVEQGPPPSVPWPLHASVYTSTTLLPPPCLCPQEAQTQQYEKFFKACEDIRNRQNKELEIKRALEEARLAALEKAVPPSAADAKKRGKAPAGKKK